MRGKWILACRASGMHRLPSYQRTVSKGPWSPRDKITPSDALHPNHIWTNCLAPVPYQKFPDGSDNLDTYQEGYGAHLIILHPFKSPWVVEAGIADGWITGDGGDPEESWGLVSQWLETQKIMREILNRNNQEEIEDKLTKLENGIFADKKTGVECIENFPGNFDACITFDDFSVSTASHIAEKLDLITTPRSVIEVIKNKYKLRQVCQQIGIPVPRSLIFRLNDLFLGKLDPILNPGGNTPSPDDNKNDQINHNVNDNNVQIAKTLPPGQRLCLHSNEWVNSGENGENGESGEKYTKVEFDNPTTPSEWEEYYIKKALEVSSSPLQYPLVIKPFSGAGSNFVRKAHNYDELVDVFRLFYNQTKDIHPTNHVQSAHNKPTTCVAHRENSNHNDDTEIVDLPPEQLELLRTKWKCWGLPDIDVSFMIEECIRGTEFDLDVLIQDSQILYASINDNFPTAGHAAYFLEAGGLVQSSQPFKQQVAMRVMTNFILKFFHDYFLSDDNVKEFGECLNINNISQKKCHVNTKYEDKCSNCKQYRGINGVWHFEGMIAKNMSWAKQYEYGILSDYNQVTSVKNGHDDSNNQLSQIPEDDFYVCMPIEINQRVGGSEVQCLSSICSGIEYAVDDIKLHCKGVKLPNYFSYLPQFTEMNRLGWERFPSSPDYDQEQVYNPNDANLVLTNDEQASLDKNNIKLNDVKNLLKTTFVQNPLYKSIPFPSRPVAVRKSIPIPAEYNRSLHPMANIPEGVNSGPQLHTHLPLPINLQPKLELIPYDYALSIAHTYNTLLGLSTPGSFYPPADQKTGLEVPRWRCATSINYAPRDSGILKSNGFPDEVINDPTYLGGMLWWKPGDKVFFPPLGFDCLGWLTAGGNTPAEAHYHMLRLSAELRYVIEPLSETPK
jgi:hypothetical protein